MIKNTIIYLIIIIILIGCNQNKYSDINSGLLVIDVNRTDYPTLNFNLHDIAYVEYIPLETTENSLLIRAGVFSISDNYIVTSEIQNGDVWIFDRSGKFIRSFNKRGNGPGEYLNILKLVCDFEKEEIFIYRFLLK